MKRLLPLALFLTCCAHGERPIEFYVGPHKDLTVTIPSIRKEDLRGIMAEFFSRNDPSIAERFRKLFADSGDVTLVLTSK